MNSSFWLLNKHGKTSEKKNFLRFHKLKICNPDVWVVTFVLEAAFRVLIRKWGRETDRADGDQALGLGWRGKGRGGKRPKARPPMLPYLNKP
jgi:hypothetical protein